jgi:hypothetical protein
VTTVHAPVGIATITAPIHGQFHWPSEPLKIRASEEAISSIHSKRLNYRAILPFSIPKRGIICKNFAARLSGSLRIPPSQESISKTAQKTNCPRNLTRGKAALYLQTCKVFGHYCTKMLHVKHFGKVWPGIGQKQTAVLWVTRRV